MLEPPTQPPTPNHARALHRAYARHMQLAASHLTACGCIAACTTGPNTGAHALLHLADLLELWAHWAATETPGEQPLPPDAIDIDPDAFDRVAGSALQLRAAPPSACGLAPAPGAPAQRENVAEDQPAAPAQQVAALRPRNSRGRSD